MKLLCITDLHAERGALERILKDAGAVDVVLLGGDITNFGTVDEAAACVGLAQNTGAAVLAVAGNCDSAAIDDRLVRLGVSLFGRGVVREGVGFYGVSAMPPWHGTMYELSEEEIAAALEAGRAALSEHQREVVLSHSPPRDMRVDRTRRGEHVGSTAVREFVEAVQPALLFCGHIHEGRGIDAIGETTVVNCGPAFDGHYALARLDEDVEVSLSTAPNRK